MEVISDWERETGLKASASATQACFFVSCLPVKAFFLVFHLFAKRLCSQDLGPQAVAGPSRGVGSGASAGEIRAAGQRVTPTRPTILAPVRTFPPASPGMTMPGGSTPKASTGQKRPVPSSSRPLNLPKNQRKASGLRVYGLGFWV